MPLDALDDGHCWVEYEDLLDRANALLIMDTLDSREIISKRLDEMIEAETLSEYHFDNRLLVSLPSIFHQEAFIGGTFQKLCSKQ